jgi:hypothetical protein
LTGEQEFTLQKKPLGQSVSTAQAPWHFVPLHGTAAPQGFGTCTQLPEVHDPAGVSTAFGIVPVQEAAAPHTVPLATGAWHTPLWQVSIVQELLSFPQAVPSSTFECWQPRVALQESLVQTLPSLQFSEAPAWQTPLKHWSFCVQTLLSALQEVPEIGLAWQVLPFSLQTPVLH